MEYHVGLDVSQKAVSICVADGGGVVVAEPGRQRGDHQGAPVFDAISLGSAPGRTQGLQESRRCRATPGTDFAADLCRHPVPDAITRQTNGGGEGITSAMGVATVSRVCRTATLNRQSGFFGLAHGLEIAIVVAGEAMSRFKVAMSHADQRPRLQRIASGARALTQRAVRHRVH